jgi:hypothetical protein
MLAHPLPEIWNSGSKTSSTPGGCWARRIDRILRWRSRSARCQGRWYFSIIRGASFLSLQRGPHAAGLGPRYWFILIVAYPRVLQSPVRTKRSRIPWGQMGVLFSLSKAATSSALSVSEVALLVFTLLLVVGLVGEAAKSEKWKARHRMFELMVVIGVSGELIAEGGIFAFSRHLQTVADTDLAAVITKVGDARTSAYKAADAAARANVSAQQANNEAGVAEERAEAARKDAEREHRARVQLEAAIAPRSLTNKQQKEIVDAWRPCAKPRIRVVVETSFPSTLGFQIWNALREAGFSAQLKWAQRPLHEVSMSGPLEDSDALNCIGGALVKKVPIAGVMGILPAGSPIWITVGDRIIGPLPK